MAAVFFYFLELSIVASIIIVAIILLRLLFRNRISAHFHYVLWGLLLIKLCIPIEISSPLSVFQFVNKQEATNITMNQLTTNPQQQETALIPNSNVENKAEINKPTSTEQVILPDEKQSIFTGMNILVTIWLAVIVLLLCFVSATIISTKQKLKKTMYHPLVNELTMECMNELMMRRKVSVICSPYYRTPFVFGIFKPVVVIPYHLMETLN
ncbi:MAG: M56 family metallopeptidase, partial [Bacillaceae bacterium]